ncbi:unnamed protein product, partial [Clonostachys byssicola]
VRRLGVGGELARYLFKVLVRVGRTTAPHHLHAHDGTGCRFDDDKRAPLDVTGLCRPPHSGLVRGPPYPLGFQRRIARWKSGERLKKRAISEEAECKE